MIDSASNQQPASDSERVLNLAFPPEQCDLPLRSADRVLAYEIAAIDGVVDHLQEPRTQCSRPAGTPIRWIMVGGPELAEDALFGLEFPNEPGQGLSLKNIVNAIRGR